MMAKAKKLIQFGLLIENIAKVMGLFIEEIEKL